jgi:NAD(P)-dependent dehydrogenase (short-subunit alcohol dehydrogenase family)
LFFRITGISVVKTLWVSPQLATNRGIPLTLNSTSTVVVTGASSGIGRAAALDLARSEHRVYAAARRERELRTLADTHPGISALPLDVTDPDSVAAAEDRVHLETGGRAVIANTERTPELGSLPVPVRFAFGERDQYLDPALARSLAGFFGRGEVT